MASSRSLGLEVVEVGLVDHREDVLRETPDEGDQGVAGDRTPGGVVRGGDEEQPGARCDRRLEGSEIDMAVLERDEDRDRIALLGIADEARERRPGHDDLVSGLQDGLADVPDQGVRARGHGHLRGRHPVPRGESRRELVRAAPRIAVQPRHGCLDRLAAPRETGRSGPR